MVTNTLWIYFTGGDSLRDRLAIPFCQGGVQDIMVKTKAKPQHYARPNARLRRLEKKKEVFMDMT